MSKPIIGFDLDDVLSPQSVVWMQHHNEKHGTSLTIKDFQVPGEYWSYFETVLHRQGISQEEATERFGQFIKDKVPLKQVIDPDAFPVLRFLQKKYDLEIITSRSAEFADGTKTWLNQQAPDIFRDIHFVDLWSKGDQKTTKAQICRAIGAGYLIDDNVEHCNLASEAGVQALLFGKFGWNIDAELNEGVIRVDGWADVRSFFESI